MSLSEFTSKTDTEINKCVVRIITNTWSDAKGLHTKRDVLYLKRLSNGYNILREEMDITDADYVKKLIRNLDKVRDGVYEVVMTNVSRDFETGYIDGFDLELVPFHATPEYHTKRVKP